MNDLKEIRQELWHSLDMSHVKLMAVRAGLFAAVECIIVAIVMDTGEKWHVLGMLLAISILPILLYCLFRTAQIFRAAESYTFSTVQLSSPLGGKIRDTIRFRVVLKNAEGRSVVTHTRSIFYIRSGLLGPSFEDYVNQYVMVAYNEKTRNTVVIG